MILHFKTPQTLSLTSQIFKACNAQQFPYQDIITLKLHKTLPFLVIGFQLEKLSLNTDTASINLLP